jgi:hypothetical protein
MNPLELLTGMQPNLAAATPPPNNPMAAFQLGARPESEEVIGARRELDGLREQDDFVSTWLKGELASKKEPSRKSLAADALANFARGALMGPRFKSAQDEQAERDAVENQRKAAMIQAAVSNLRAKQAAIQAQMTDARLREQTRLVDEDRNQKLAIEQQRADTAAAAQVAREKSSNAWLSLREKQAKTQETQFDREMAFKEGVKAHGNLIAFSASNANLKAKAENRTATAEDYEREYLHLLKEGKAIEAKYRPSPQSARSIPGGDLTPTQSNIVHRAITGSQSDKDLSFYRDMSDMHSIIKENAEGEITGPGSNALLRSFAKMLDNRTGVREEEYRALMKAAGILNTWELFRSGQWAMGDLLTPEAAKQFLDVADKIMQRAEKKYDPSVRRWVMQLESAGIDQPYERLGLRPPRQGVDEPAPASGPAVSRVPQTSGQRGDRLKALGQKYGVEF